MSVLPVKWLNDDEYFFFPYEIAESWMSISVLPIKGLDQEFEFCSPDEIIGSGKGISVTPILLLIILHACLVRFRLTQYNNILSK